jgi:hypothetical protein
MRWFRTKNNRPNTDWEFFDGYPPALRMRQFKDGAWHIRAATDAEMREFKACEAEFVARPTAGDEMTTTLTGRLPPHFGSDT